MNQEFARAPHRRGDPTAPLHTAALLIDFDNVTMGIRSNLGQELRTLLDSDVIRGKVAVQRAYADWRRYPQYIVPLSESSIDLIFAPAYGSSKKNATDIRLAIDALELVFTRPEIRTFILLSGDSDFSSLVLKLKEYGKYVIGVGLQESTSDILVQNCDEYYSYNRLSGLQSADEIETQKHDPWELATAAVRKMVDRGDVMRSDRLKQVMLEIDPSFDEKTAGFTKFNRFLAEAAHRNLLRMRKGENGQYEVAPVEDDGSSGRSSSSGSSSTASSSSSKSSSDESRDRGSSRRSSRGRGRRGGRSGRDRSEDRDAGPKAEEGGGRGSETPKPGTLGADIPEVALAEAYEALTTVVAELYDGESPVRDSMAKRKMLERDSSFDEGALGFSKFSRFLHQADDEGIVNLTQEEDGNYYLTPVEEGGSRSKGHDAESEPSADRGGRDAGDRQAPAPEAKTEDAGGDEGAREESALARAARRTLGRFRRGSKSATEEPAKRSTSRIGPVDTGTKADAESGNGARRSEGGAEARSERSSGRQTGSPSGAATTAEAEPAPEAEAPDGGGSGAGESVDAGAPAGTGTPAETGTSAGSGAGTAEAGAAASRSRTLGRYRQGSKGRSSAPASGGSSGGPRIGPVPDSELPGRSSDSAPSREPAARVEDVSATPGEASAPQPDGGPIDHMVRNYAGVGKRTAEALVERFGDHVFSVIDESPEKLSEVLSEGRARTVIEARRKEIEDA